MDDLAADGGQNALDDVVAAVQRELAGLVQVLDQIVDVLGKHPSGAGGQHTGDVLDAFDGDAVLHSGLAGNGQSAVAALVDGDVNDDGTINAVDASMVLTLYAKM